jgi:hypothetical protein
MRQMVGGRSRAVQMNCSLPYWMLVSQALLTPTIALLAVVIGLFQWRTAQQTVVLDLFDRRLAKYTAVSDLYRKVMGAGTATEETTFQFREAMDGVEFLFGDDIVNSLNAMHVAIIELSAVSPELKDEEPGPNREALVKKERQAKKDIERFYATFCTCLKPYMWMRQKSAW